MEDFQDIIKITDEDLTDFSIEELTDLKVELDNLSLRIDYLLEECKNIINN